jgi:hypothetical protein
MQVFGASGKEVVMVADRSGIHRAHRGCCKNRVVPTKRA